MKRRNLSALVVLLGLLLFSVGVPFLSIRGVPEAKAVFNQVSTLTAASGENKAAAMAAYDGYLYVATGSPSRLLKIRLSDFYEVGSLIFDSGYDKANVVQRVGDILYVATDQSPAKIVKVDLTSFTQVGGLTLNTGENQTAAIGYSGNVLYVGTWTYPAKIVRINLTDFTRMGSLTLNAGEDRARSIIVYGGYLHVGTFSTPARVVRVRISDFTRHDSLIFSSGENGIEAGCLEGSIVYYSHYDSAGTGKLSKVNLSTFQKLNVITLSERYLAAVNIKDRYIYVGVYDTPSKVVKVDKTTFSEVQKLICNAGEDFNEPSVIYGDYLYLGMNTSPAKIAKIDIRVSPVITYFSPADTTPDVSEGGSLAFKQVSSDPDGDTLYYVWLLDNVMQASSQNWTYSPGYNAAGVHNVTLLVTDPFGLPATQQWSVTVLNVNRAPTITYFSPADTTPDVSEGGSLAFKHVSSDPDGPPLYYVWLLDHVMQSASQNWTYLPDYKAVGVHNVTLVVSDPYGSTDTQQWSVTVLGVNMAPTITYFSPADTTPQVSEGGSLAFEHVSSDLDGDPLYYVWLLDHVMQSASQNWTYMSGYFAAGVHNVTLVVSDPYGLIDSQQWSVAVVNDNRAPTIDYYSPVDTSPEVDEGGSLAFEHVSSDLDGDPIYYVWLLDHVMQASSQNWTFMPDFFAAGSHNVTLVVSDSYGSTASQQWSVTVNVNNRAPTIDYYAPADTSPEVDEGSSLAFEHVSSDLDGDPICYVWLLDHVMQSASQNWTYMPGYFAAGVHNVTLLISDSYGSTASQQWSVTVLNVNRAPTIDYYAPADTTPEVSEGSSLAFEHVSSDLDGDPIYYVWLLDHVMQASSQNWTFMPDFFAAGSHNVTLVVSDSYGSIASQQWNVTVLNVNRTPTISYYAPADTTPDVNEGSNLAFEHVSSDLDNDPLYYVWLLDHVMQASSQNWTYTPGYNAAGVHNVTLVVSDPYGSTASQQWSVTVANVNRAPTIDYYSPADTTPEVSEGGSLAFEQVSSDLDGDPLYYAWLLDNVMQSASQNWTYTPDYNAAGVHNVTLLVTDSYGLLDLQQWIVTVVDVP